MVNAETNPLLHCVLKWLPTALVLLLLSGMAPSLARADFGATQPDSWARNRCVARSAMVAGLLAMPAGIAIAATAEEPMGESIGIGAGLLGAGAFGAGLGLRLRMATSPEGAAGWATPQRDLCRAEAASIWSLPIMTLGAILFELGLDMDRASRRRFVSTLGVLVAGAGLATAIYGRSRARQIRRGARVNAPALLSLERDALSFRLSASAVELRADF